MPFRPRQSSGDQREWCKHYVHFQGQSSRYFDVEELNDKEVEDDFFYALRQGVLKESG